MATTEKERIEFVKKLIRTAHKKTKRQTCYVCGKYKSIAELHHLIPVSEMARRLVIENVAIKELPRFSFSAIWLCPNHHAMLHLMRTNKLRAVWIGTETSQEEFQNLKGLWHGDHWQAFEDFIATATKGEWE